MTPAAGVSIPLTCGAMLMFVGVYWSSRGATREDAAGKLVRFLEAVRKSDGSPSAWFLKAKTESGARDAIDLDASKFVEKLAVDCDYFGQPMSELGYRLSIWDGGDTTFSASVGACSPYVMNSVVLSFGRRPVECRPGDWKAMLEAAISAFDPDYGVITSDDHLEREGATDPWESGWFTFERGGRIQEHPFA